MSCWRRKKYVWGAMNLHELPRINRKTERGQVIFQREGGRQETLLPMPAILPDDIFDIAFIYQVVAGQDRLDGETVFTTVNDLPLILERDLRIRNERGGDQGVSMMTRLTEDSPDRKDDSFGQKLNFAVVGTVADQATRFSARAFHHMERELLH